MRVIMITYSADLTAGSLKTRESRILADLLLQEADEQAWGIPRVRGELFAKFHPVFFADPSDAVFKALGAE